MTSPLFSLVLTLSLPFPHNHAPFLSPSVSIPSPPITHLQGEIGGAGIGFVGAEGDPLLFQAVLVLQVILHVRLWEREVESQAFQVTSRSGTVRVT